MAGMDELPNLTARLTTGNRVLKLVERTIPYLLTDLPKGTLVES